MKFIGVIRRDNDGMSNVTKSEKLFSRQPKVSDPMLIMVGLAGPNQNTKVVWDRVILLIFRSQYMEDSFEKLYFLIDLRIKSLQGL